MYDRGENNIEASNDCGQGWGSENRQKFKDFARGKGHRSRTVEAIVV
jgi:hypothetical protein